MSGKMAGSLTAREIKLQPELVTADKNDHSGEERLRLKCNPAAAVATAAMLRLRLQVQGIPPQALEHLLAGKVVTWVPLVQLLRSLEGERISPRMRVGLVALLLMVMPQRG